MKDVNARKIDIIKWLADEDAASVIAKIQELIAEIEYDKASDTMVIGYRLNGRRVIKSRFLHNIRLAELGVETGEFLTFEQFEQESENW